MMNDLDAYFAALRASELAPYYAEIEAKESPFLSRLRHMHGDDRPPVYVLGWSFWNGPEGLEALSDIDRRHGIETDVDPRVYSIAAYRAERRSIEAEIRERTGATVRGSGFDWEEVRRSSGRLADCETRHFPGFVAAIDGPIEAISSIPRLWKHLECLLSSLTGATNRYLFNGETPEHIEYANKKYESFILAPMLELGIPWTPPSPPEPLGVARIHNEIRRIINRIEREEAEELRALWLPARDIVTKPREAGPAGRLPSSGIDRLAEIVEGANPPGRRDASQAGQTHDLTEPRLREPRRRGLKQPSARDFQCYRLNKQVGWDQTKIAREIFGSGSSGHQGMVSKAISRVVEWLEAGKMMPDEDSTRPRVVPVDPSKLDLGPRQDTGRRRNK